MKKIKVTLYHLSYLIPRIMLLTILFSVFHLNCDSPTEPYIPSDITYTVSGGFGGGIYTKLVIDQYGIASLESEYPALKQQLTPEEYNSLLVLFNGFEKFPDTTMIRCADSFIYTVEYKVDGHTKIFGVDNCILSDLQTDYLIRKFKLIIDELSRLAGKIYNEQATWIGLTADYKMDKNIYKTGEPVQLTYILKNPTGNERTLYFKNQYVLYFQIYKTDYPLIYYSYPKDYGTDSTNPAEITLSPGEQKSFYYVWDQRMTENGKPVQVPIGMYSVSMHFLGGKVNGAIFFFDIVDPSIPIEGKVVPDPNGESSYSQDYSFQLLIKNWTNTPVTLDFPNSQKISFQLYSDDIPSNRELLYECPVVKDSQSSRITIPAQGERTFSCIQNKENLNLGNIYWFYVRIKLLSSTLNFERDAEISIYKYVN